MRLAVEPMSTTRLLSALLALLATVSCSSSKNCLFYLGSNNTAVHESDITLSQPATTADAQICLDDDECLGLSFGATVPGEAGCITAGGVEIPGNFCVTPITTDTLHVGGNLVTSERQPLRPPATVRLTITDHESGEVLFDEKRNAHAIDFKDDGCHTKWSAEVTF